MEMAPAINSAIPPNTTTFVSSNVDKPAVKANGTVIPSDKPMMASEITRASTKLFFSGRLEGTEELPSL
jgi:hypothetical protein